MNCKKVEEYAEKYMNGELNEAEKRKVEKHIRECSSCRKKYSSALLLGAVLYASEKTAIHTTLSLLWYIKKAAAVGAAAAIITTGIIAVNSSKEEKNKKISEEKVEKNITESSTIKEKIGIYEKSKKIKDNNKKIKIISKEAEKEIEYNLDSKNLKIETRIER
jgi:hypothetical protein